MEVRSDPAHGMSRRRGRFDNESEAGLGRGLRVHGGTCAAVCSRARCHHPPFPSRRETQRRYPALLREPGGTGRCPREPRRTLGLRPGRYRSAVHSGRSAFQGRAQREGSSGDPGDQRPADPRAVPRLHRRGRLAKRADSAPVHRPVEPPDDDRAAPGRGASGCGGGRDPYPRRPRRYTARGRCAPGRGRRRPAATTRGGAARRHPATGGRCARYDSDHAQRYAVGYRPARAT